MSRALIARVRSELCAHYRDAFAGAGAGAADVCVAVAEEDMGRVFVRVSGPADSPFAGERGWLCRPM